MKFLHKDWPFTCVKCKKRILIVRPAAIGNIRELYPYYCEEAAKLGWKKLAKEGTTMFDTHLCPDCIPK